MAFNIRNFLKDVKAKALSAKETMMAALGKNTGPDETVRVAADVPQAQFERPRMAGHGTATMAVEQESKPVIPLFVQVGRRGELLMAFMDVTTGELSPAVFVQQKGTLFSPQSGELAHVFEVQSTGTTIIVDSTTGSTIIANRDGEVVAAFGLAAKNNNGSVGSRPSTMSMPQSSSYYARRGGAAAPLL